MNELIYVLIVLVSFNDGTQIEATWNFKTMYGCEQALETLPAIAADHDEVESFAAICIEQGQQ